MTAIILPSRAPSGSPAYAPTSRPVYRGGAGIATTTWNPADKGADIVLSGGDLSVSNSTAGSWMSVRSVGAKTSGKWMYEMTVPRVPAAPATGVGDVIMGVGTSASSLTTFTGGAATSYGYQGAGGSGRHWNNAANVAAGAEPTGTPAYWIISVCVDVDNKVLTYYIDGVQVPNTKSFAAISGNIYAMCSVYSSLVVVPTNFGASGFAYPVTGYEAWTP